MFWKIFANAKNNILLGASFVSLRLPPSPTGEGRSASANIFFLTFVSINYQIILCKTI